MQSLKLNHMLDLAVSFYTALELCKQPFLNNHRTLKLGMDFFIVAYNLETSHKIVMAE